ncbi:unnamed protein product [Meloidogyne enterolobii]|uniref:Uncharacterized protein n=1 Tax=Meloidogyne enterolobii TaxID=390850 RepID=A0ACB0XSM7_MELEN
MLKKYKRKTKNSKKKKGSKNKWENPKYNFYKKKTINSKVNPIILKDSTKQMLNFPVEVKLDILKFLNFDQLLSFQQTNYYFYCLIRQNESVLACNYLLTVGTEKVKFILYGFNW